MEKKAIRRIVLALLLTSILTLVFNTQVKLVKASALTPHSPILINGDSGFVPANGVTGGSGTASDSYIIEGWDIDASTAHGIDIQNTRAHFIIRNVAISGGIPNYRGIRLYDVENGAIMKTTMTENYWGVRFESSNYNNISENFIAGNTAGILLCGSSSNNLISGNQVVGNGYALRLTGSSDYNIISGNNITGNTEYGIGADDWSNYNIISGNLITGNGGAGIGLGASSNLVYNNYFSNPVNAIVDWSNDFNITKTPGRNIVGGPYLGGNYWSDYTGADADGDGIGDTPYYISGGAGTIDNLPLVPVPILTITITNTKNGKTETITLELIDEDHDGFITLDISNRILSAVRRTHDTTTFDFPET